MFVFSSVVYGEKVSAPLFHIILVIAWEMSVFHFAIYKAFAFSLSCTLALSLYVFSVHMSWIDTWNCVWFTGSVSLIVFHCKGDPMFVIYSAFFQRHYCERSARSIPLLIAVRFPDLSECEGNRSRESFETLPGLISEMFVEAQLFESSHSYLCHGSGPQLRPGLTG